MFGATTGLQTHIWNTNARCVVLLALYPFIVLATAWLICAGLTLSAGRPDWAATASALLAQAWPAVLAAVGAWFLISWLWHTRMVRAMARSRPVTREEAPALYNALENLCISRGLPMPQLEIMETSARNAFASGIGPRSYTITVTRGLVDDLKPDELEAVLAHELAHILHGDVRLLIVAVIFTGAFSFAAQMAWRSLRYGVGRTRGGKGGLAIVAVAVALSVGWVFAVLVRYALSRRREYMADAGAVDLTRNPEALMRALQRLGAKAALNNAAPDIALMATHSEKKFLGLFATHPPLADRIAAISALTNTPVPEVREEWLSREEVAQVLVRERLRRNPWFRGRD
jgi:heat shock protein HtpX